MSADFSDAELLRYGRHILLDEIGIEGQRKIRDGRALIIGAGGLGAPASLYMAAAGVGELTLVDDDKVETSNLQRQIIHSEADLGRAKVESALDRLHGINSDVRVIALRERLNGARLQTLVAAADVVLDCSDNFSTRHAVNRACVSARVPLVSGAAVRFDAQFSVFDARRAESPCYRCLFPESGEETDGPCATFGVFAPIVGIVGSMQAAEALKILAGVSGAPIGRLITLDLRTHEWRTMRFTRDPECPVCGSHDH